MVVKGGFLAALLFICGVSILVERERERARARSLQSYSSVIILCSSRFFQVERSESPSLLERQKPCFFVRPSLYCVWSGG